MIKSFVFWELQPQAIIRYYWMCLVAEVNPAIDPWSISWEYISISSTSSHDDTSFSFLLFF